MKEVVIYTTRFCPFCIRAKYLLDNKNVPYKEIAVDGKPALRAEMTAKAGRHTVPQIWVGGHHVGGCDDLMAIERSGELDRLLA
ncbi:glutaredoxin 3 [Microbulbifer pacificus]|uniref:Glutaredoxin n=1 Tax=Microbulbifer pacificus TaxID=407164 RepID=A0AAU0MW44_9GAMM|nr:glutaredoxin 3 [Microbulbifer pacificus]WOX04242.1 glutaredoxin 3 [Microbulbifer pacificus]